MSSSTEAPSDTAAAPAAAGQAVPVLLPPVSAGFAEAAQECRRPRGVRRGGLVRVICRTS